MPVSNGEQSLDLVLPGQSMTVNSWMVSDWNAGQSSLLQWSPDNVRTASDGVVDYILSAAPAGSERPYLGAEVQSMAAVTTGLWSWTAQAPKMVDGAVFGLFTYRADWQNQPWVEFDIEFVGADTHKVQLNIHMEDPAGNQVRLDQRPGGPITVDLGFDASEGFHRYEVAVTETYAVFLVDGVEVGRFSAADMPGNVWQLGPMHSFVNLWAVAPAQEGWAGLWNYGGTPLVGRVAQVSVEPDGALDPEVQTTGLAGNGGANLITGTDEADLITGLAGNDSLSGGLGNDSLYGGAGNDSFGLDAGRDRLDGGSGRDQIVVHGTLGATIDLALTQAQATGLGRDTILNIEDIYGAAGKDHLAGSEGDNLLYGNGNTDTLLGRGGDDTLCGGGADDKVYGGTGADVLFLDAGNDLMDGGRGRDWLYVSGTRAATVDLAQTGVQVTGYGSDTILRVENLSGSVRGDLLSGNDAANILVGNGGADTLTGAGGADRLIGGMGRDLMFGGAGSDVFCFEDILETAVGYRRDVIADFTPGRDLVDLSAINAHATALADTAFAFAGKTAAAHSVWLSTRGADLLLHGDVTGDGKADFEIRFLGILHLTASDFVL